MTTCCIPSAPFTSYTADSLTAGTTYAYQIAAVDQSDRPLAPVGEWTFTAVNDTAIAETRRSLGTNPNDDTIQHYEYRKKTGSAAWGSWTRIPNSSATTTDYEVTCAAGPICVIEVRPVIHPATNEATATPPTNTGWLDISATITEAVGTTVSATRTRKARPKTR